MTRLEELTFEDPNPEFPEEMPNLTSLNCPHISKSDLRRFLPQLREIKTLNIPEILPEISENIQCLTTGSSFVNTDVRFSRLTNLTRLETLNLNSEDLSYLTNLMRLDVSVGVSDEPRFFDLLLGLTNLVDLEIGNVLNGEETYFRSFPKLTRVGCLNRETF
jgi:hypothetical protein